MQGADFAPVHSKAISDLGLWLARATRIQTQQRNDKNRLYALHAPEVERIAKGKAPMSLVSRAPWWSRINTA